MDVREALRAICSTGEGSCWYCNAKLPGEEQAIATGWDVKRLEGERLASLMLICPTCQRLKAELGEAEFLHNLSLRVCNATY